MALRDIPRRGPGGCGPNSEAWSPASPAPAAGSGSSPARSLSRASCGTLQPHPFRSEKAVRRKPRSSPWSSGLKGLYPGSKQPSTPTASAGGVGGVEPDMCERYSVVTAAAAQLNLREDMNGATTTVAPHRRQQHRKPRWTVTSGLRTVRCTRLQLIFLINQKSHSTCGYSFKHVNKACNKEFKRYMNQYSTLNGNSIIEVSELHPRTE